jgi:hypothetical protein
VHRVKAFGGGVERLGSEENVILPVPPGPVFDTVIISLRVPSLLNIV